MAVTVTPILAQMQGGPFEIPKSTLDGGGGRSTSAQFELVGTFGQPEASGQPLLGGGFELHGGFWPGNDRVPEGDLIFIEGFEGP